MNYYYTLIIALFFLLLVGSNPVNPADLEKRKIIMVEGRDEWSFGFAGELHIIKNGKKRYFSKCTYTRSKTQVKCQFKDKGYAKFEVKSSSIPRIFEDDDEIKSWKLYHKVDGNRIEDKLIANTSSDNVFKYKNSSKNIFKFNMSNGKTKDLYYTKVKVY
ncbi:hypothetical protein BCR32DRAFT_271579 [Anaeromyces robustus]|uniref:Fascin domain-containing protein n=1 Tax=Anaeromyces robustus TaxID=1754192 RepID=A0A1Y1WR21_9FUNG|nr:hypothetical protein BCR32DRAFT_271579 [Anaeromyces robustus]|eukprot:ORX75977.1 hypothetical protein BCR32DRAFT_271579 [Anaeromyces robustus]